jgi:hypothetical protein
VPFVPRNVGFIYSYFPSHVATSATEAAATAATDAWYGFRQPDSAKHVEATRTVPCFCPRNGGSQGLRCLSARRSLATAVAFRHGV